MTKFLNNADVKGYVAQTAVTSSLLKTDSNGKLVAAVADTDYATPGALASADKMVTIGRNATGATLYQGTIVYILGSTGNRPNFVKAQADNEPHSSQTFGVVLADIPNNSDGNVVTMGTISNLDTRTTATNPFTDVTLADGDTIYLHPTIAGYVTNVKPSAPNHLVYVGKVVRTSPTNGTIVYRIQNGYELEELHNVAIATLANNQTIVWESATNLWKNKTIAAALGYTPADDSLVLKLTGGTLTGDLTLSGTNPRLYFTDTDNNPDYFISNTDGTFTVYDVTNSVGRFKIYSTGNAEFTGALSVGGNLSVNNGANTTVSLNGTAFVGIEYSRNSNIYGFVGTENSASGGMRYNSVNGNYEHNFYTNSSLSFKLSSTGAATFSSSVTATSGIFSGTSSEPLRVERIIAGTVYGKYSLAISGSGVFSVYDAVAAVDRFAITSSGNIGAGNTNPFGGASGINGMHITSLSANSAFFRINNASYTGFDLIQGNDGTGYLWLRDNQMIQIGTNNTERIRVTNAGRIIVNNSVANDSGDRNLTIQGSLSATNNDVASINLTQVWNGVSYPAILAVQQDLSYGNASGIFVLKTSYWNGSSVVTSERLRVAALGQLKLSAYTSSTSFSGTAAGYLAFDSSGNVITVAGVSSTDNTKLPLAGGTTTGIVTFSNSNNTTDNVRFQNTDGNYAYIRQTAASNSNNIWYDGTLGATMWYAWDNPGSARTAGVYTQHIFGTGRGTSNESVNINRGGIFGTNSSGTQTYSISRDGAVSLSGGITTTAAGGSILLKHAVSEVDAWIFQENAANWGLYWKNNPTGQHTFGGYTSVGAELVGMSAANSSGNGVLTSNYVGATTAYAQWMISNYTGYIWSASTIYAATSMVVAGNTVIHAGNIGSYTAGSAQQVTINYNNDSNSTYQLLWGSGNSVYGTSQVYVNPSSDVIYARGGYISPSNPWGTADSAYFPNGISTAGGQNWIYGATYIGNAPSNGSGVLVNSNGSSYFRSNVGTNSHGQSARFLEIQSAAGNFIPYSFESEYGNHSWGTVMRIRINQVSADRPSIQFSSASNDNRWNVGYCYADDNFRVTQNMGYRNDNSTSDGWGTERFRINTDGNTYAAIGGTLYANGNTVLHSANYSSYALPLSGGTVTGVAYFLTNKGGYCGSLDTAGLEAYSTGNNSAFLSFHKAGYYAVNMGLDADNVLRIGGWSASANRWQLDMSGNCTVAGSMYGSYFYGSGSIRCGDMWGGAGLYRPSGDMVFGTEAANWVFSSQANTRAYFNSSNGNLWMQWAGDWLSNLLAAKVNTSSVSGLSVNYANYAGYLPTAYAGGQQLNPQVYFNNGIGLKVAMTASWGYWSDTMWVNGYSGSDVPWMCALHFLRNSEPRFAISAQTHGSGSYGSIYEVITSYNIANQTVSTANNLSGFDKTNPSFGAVYASNWFRAYGDCGLYSQDYGGHLRRNTNSYGTWETFGYNKNGWGGISTSNNYVTAKMHNSSGDFGFLTENGNWWNLFYNNANNCWGIGTDNTYSGDGFRCIKYGSAQYGWTTWSDRRAKENIASITGALDTVLAMRGVYFNYIQDEAKNKRVGFIAQELEQVLPEAVRYAEEIDEYSVEYAQIVSVLAEAIKEQNSKIIRLEALVEQLTNN